jgi:hypothetical protein
MGVVEEMTGPPGALEGGHSFDFGELEPHDVGVEDVGRGDVTRGDGDMVKAHGA